MPNVTRLIRDQGADFTNFYVEQSSCCPSRASILSGLYAHNHGVIGNVWPEGGYDRWKQTKQGDDLPVWLERSGYRNALLGKYFNEYPYHPGNHLSDAEEGDAAVVRAAGLAVVGLAGAGQRLRAEPLPAERRRDGRRGLPRGLPRLVARSPGRRPGRRQRRLRLRRRRAVHLLRVVQPAHAVRLPEGARGHLRGRAVPAHAGLRRGRRVRQVRADPDPQGAVGVRPGDHRRDVPQADPVGAGARPDRRRAGAVSWPTRARSTTPT